jgi:hypothetical protein
MKLRVEPRVSTGFNPGLCTQIGETADIWKSSLMVRIDTGGSLCYFMLSRVAKIRGDRFPHDLSKKSLEIYQHLSPGAVEQAYQGAVQGVSI